MKLIFLVLGAAIGFGIGVYWGVHNPTQAGNLSKQEEADFIKIAENATAKLNAIVAKQQAAGTSGGSINIPIPGSSFAGSGSAPAVTHTGVDPELQSLSGQMQSQLDALKAKAHVQ